MYLTRKFCHVGLGLLQNLLNSLLLFFKWTRGCPYLSTNQSTTLTLIILTPSSTLHPDLYNWCKESRAWHFYRGTSDSTWRWTPDTVGILAGPRWDLSKNCQSCYLVNDTRRGVFRGSSAKESRMGERNSIRTAVNQFDEMSLELQTTMDHTNGVCMWTYTL